MNATNTRMPYTGYSTALALLVLTVQIGLAGSAK